eukprot:scaffold106697_cov51-Attheya_sp.AAC.1
MKYLEDEKLSQLTSELTDALLCGTNRRVLNGRIEAYSMKRAGTDKKYAHALGERYVQEMEVVESDLARVRDLLVLGGSSVKSGGTTVSSSVDTVSVSATASSSGRRRSQSVSVCDKTNPTSSSSSSKKSKPNNNNNDSTQNSNKNKSRARSSSFNGEGPRKSSLIQHNNNTPSGSKNHDPFSNSALGNFHDSHTQRLMTDLILTLNMSFPDYDFSSIRPSHIKRLPSAATAVNRTNEKLSEFAATTQKGAGFLPRLWTALDETISLTDCEVFSYVPPPKDDDDDPLQFLWQTLADYDLLYNSNNHSNVNNNSTNTNHIKDSHGTIQNSPQYEYAYNSTIVPLWSFNYFFVNRSLKRIVFFACVQTMRNEAAVEDDEDFVVSETEMRPHTITTTSASAATVTGEAAAADTEGDYYRYSAMESSDFSVDTESNANGSDLAGGISVAPPTIA